MYMMYNLDQHQSYDKVQVYLIFALYLLLIVVCPFLLFLLAIVLAGLLQYTDSDCPFGVFKLFLQSSFQ